MALIQKEKSAETMHWAVVTPQNLTLFLNYHFSLVQYLAILVVNLSSEQIWMIRACVESHTCILFTNGNSWENEILLFINVIGKEVVLAQTI